MAGYSGTPLARKLGIGEGHRVGWAGGPDDFAAALDLPGSVIVDHGFSGPRHYDVIVVFLPALAALAGTVDRFSPQLNWNGGSGLPGRSWPADWRATSASRMSGVRVSRAAWWTTRYARSTGTGRDCASFTERGSTQVKNSDTEAGRGTAGAANGAHGTRIGLESLIEAWDGVGVVSSYHPETGAGSSWRSTTTPSAAPRADAA